jgi:CTP:molybdopterin cytidylyltransferase MocA
MNIKGDKGGRDLLSNFLDKSVEVDLGEAVAFDIDTNGSYELVKSNLET